MEVTVFLKALIIGQRCFAILPPPLVVSLPPRPVASGHTNSGPYLKGQGCPGGRACWARPSSSQPTALFFSPSQASTSRRASFLKSISSSETSIRMLLFSYRLRIISVNESGARPSIPKVRFYEKRLSYS